MPNMNAIHSVYIIAQGYPDIMEYECMTAGQGWLTCFSKKAANSLHLHHAMSALTNRLITQPVSQSAALDVVP